MQEQDSYFDGVSEEIKRMKTDELEKAITAEEKRLEEINKKMNSKDCLL